LFVFFFLIKAAEETICIAAWH